MKNKEYPHYTVDLDTLVAEELSKVSSMRITQSMTTHYRNKLGLVNYRKGVEEQPVKLVDTYRDCVNHILQMPLAPGKKIELIASL
jgi:hypothetical protein